jgi:hypothetical protein
MPIEAIRRQYRPEFVNVLFVGESASEDGSFFYLGDGLAEHTAQAFSRVYGETTDMSRFLERFQGNEFYLDDLCLVAVDRLSPPCREEVRIHSVPDLAKRLAAASPNVVVTVSEAIHPRVVEAMEAAGLSGIPAYVLPYPSGGSERNYVEGLVEILANLKEGGVIPVTFE